MLFPLKGFNGLVVLKLFLNHLSPSGLSGGSRLGLPRAHSILSAGPPTQRPSSSLPDPHVSAQQNENCTRYDFPHSHLKGQSFVSNRLKPFVIVIFNRIMILIVIIDSQRGLVTVPSLAILARVRYRIHSTNCFRS